MNAVKVNLLPPEYVQRQRERRLARFAAGILAVIMALLVVRGSVIRADLLKLRAQRAQAETTIAQLEAERQRLQDFDALTDRIATREALLATTMVNEISFASVLDDLALAFPQTASLLTLSATIQEQAPGSPVAKISFTGYSIEQYAPGVESVLAEFAKVETFMNPYLQTAGRNPARPNTVDFTGSFEVPKQAPVGPDGEVPPPEDVP